MIPFFDASALAKRYVREPGSKMVRDALRRPGCAVARVTYGEVAAAIAQAARRRMLDPTERATAFDRLERDFRDLAIVEIRAALVRRIPDLVVRHPLRGYDAVQLAAALTLRGEGATVELWCADVELAKAALTEGLKVVVPSGN